MSLTSLIPNLMGDQLDPKAAALLPRLGPLPSLSTQEPQLHETIPALKPMAAPSAALAPLPSFADAPSPDVSGMAGGASLPPLTPTLHPLVTNGSPRGLQEQHLEDIIGKHDAPDPAKPGFWHGLAHIAAKVGNIAGDVFAPSTMAMIPGTDLNKQVQYAGAVRQLAGLQKQDTDEQNAASQRNLQGAEAAKAEAEANSEPQESAADIALKNAQAYRAIHPLATSAFDLWHQQNPTGTAQDYETLMQKPLSQQQADSMNAVWDKMASKYGLPTGQFKAGMPATDANALSASLNNVVSRGQGAQSITIKQQQAAEKVPMLQPDGKGGYTLTYVQPGQTIAPGSATPTQVGGANEKEAGALQDAKASIDYANTYVQGGKYTGAGDEALLEKYFDLAKPSSGFRMTQQQIELLQNSRSWMESAKGQAYHASTGTWFSPQQRQQIAETMNTLYQAKAGVSGPSDIVYDDKGVEHRYKGTGSRSDPNNYEVVKK